MKESAGFWWKNQSFLSDFSYMICVDPTRVKRISKIKELDDHIVEVRKSHNCASIRLFLAQIVTLLHVYVFSPPQNPGIFILPAYN